MNREIKFRAWDKVKKQWAFGYKELGGFSVFGELHILGELQIKDLNNFEVMQFTGLLDKNGKEIYEGDVLEFFGNKKKPEHPYNEVFWQQEKGRWALRIIGKKIHSENAHGETEIIGLNEQQLERDEGYYIIIGNIYENPELITPSKE